MFVDTGGGGVAKGATEKVRSFVTFLLSDSLSYSLDSIAVSVSVFISCLSRIPPHPMFVELMEQQRGMKAS